MTLMKVLTPKKLDSTNNNNPINKIVPLNKTLNLLILI
jgi:hypothetical protein